MPPGTSYEVDPSKATGQDITWLTCCATVECHRVMVSVFGYPERLELHLAEGK